MSRSIKKTTTNKPPQIPYRPVLIQNRLITQESQHTEDWVNKFIEFIAGEHGRFLIQPASRDIILQKWFEHNPKHDRFSQAEMDSLDEALKRLCADGVLKSEFTQLNKNYCKNLYRRIII